ncbi:Hsp20/alpha crystallin family protein [Bacillus horti]|uniref:HSP20 family molecular chaperone IbpA n=1 Tax=Caldalkalibacillus horti TaxID=77523 RepID=A0ABT9W0C2_9BACI|nr:Hsp20/alpha crystallin family protein [Bacillus horti]MDQ0166681.1 HSP20 family molecular chaperone IbpA [Bacillus horti]
MNQNPTDFYKWQSMAKDLLGNEFFHDFFKQVKKDSPAYNIYKSSSEIIVLINLPYVRDLSQIKLTVRDQELQVKGKIDLGFDHLENVQSEIFSGMFEAVIPLPVVVNTKRVNANYQRGILSVQLFPKIKKEGSPVHIGEK